MNPTDPLDDAAPQFRAALEEFMSLPGYENFKDMVNDDQIAFFRRKKEILQRWPDEFRRLDWDYDAVLAQLEDSVADLTRRNAEVENATETYLQAEADLGDAEYELFKKWKKAVDELYEEHPFDPEIQRMKEELDEIAKQFPKEDPEDQDGTE